MSVLRAWWSQLSGLARDTARVWWAMLPRLLFLTLLGQISLSTTMHVAAYLGPHQSWLAIAIFAVGMMGYLAAQILMLRAVADQLDLWRRLGTDDGRERSVTRLLAVTLLPFMGLWSTFGGMEQAMSQLHTIMVMRFGEMAGSDFVRVLNPFRGNQAGWVALVVGGAYVLRRVLDAVHQRTGWTPLALVSACVEAFYTFSAIVVLARLLGWYNSWIAQSRVQMWWERWCEGLQRATDIDLGFVVDDLLPWWNATVWPRLTAATVEPLVWLAIALVVFGHSIASGDEIIADRLGIEDAAAKEVAVKVRGKLLASLNSRWMPMWTAAKLVLRSGVPLLAAYLLAFTGWRIASWWIEHGIYFSIGGHDAYWWETILPFLRAAIVMLVLPVEVVLIGVTTRRALADLVAEGKVAA